MPIKIMKSTHIFAHFSHALCVHHFWQHSQLQFCSLDVAGIAAKC